MAEYNIERNNLIDCLTKATGHKATCDSCCDIDCVDCIRDEVIKNLPTADVVEVKHGKWKQNPHCKRIYYCSVCGRHIEDGSCNPLEHFPYCHCGAKMDGKEVANSG